MPIDKKGEMGKNEIGPNISLYTVDNPLLFLLLLFGCPSLLQQLSIKLGLVLLLRL